MKNVNLRHVSRKLTQYLSGNGPTILSVVAAIGVVVTTISAVKNTPKAIERIKSDSRNNHDGDPNAYTKLEAVKSGWSCYTPSLLFGLSTIACIFGANVLNKRNQAALNSAYILMCNYYQEYRNKVKERFGNEIDSEICQDIIRDHKEGEFLNPYDPEEPSDDTKFLFYDILSDQYFNRTWKDVFSAEYHLNRNFILKGEIPLNEFYEFLGLKITELGEELGWSSSAGLEFYGYEWIDFTHQLVKLDDNLECYLINMPFPPTSDYLTL